MQNRSEQVQAAQAFLDQGMQGNQVNRILHGFPSPLYWRETEVPAAEVLTRRRQRRPAEPVELNLYVGTPYCLRTDPGKCGYCLFPVEEFTGMGQLEQYLGYLEREGHSYRPFFEGDQPSSIYFGGGTSNLYKAEQYVRLLGIVRQVFPRIDPNVGVTLEGIPQLFSREKLVRMKEVGINRISMGAQQFNDELNRLSGRKQKPEHVFQAVAWCQELGLPCNVDLIFGWPRQTVDSMMKDLERLVQTDVEHITHYELNVGGPTDFALNRRHELPTVAQNLEMYRSARDFLTGQGYRQLTAYDWERRRENGYVYEECSRGFHPRETWGWGYAGVSDFGGLADDLGWSYLHHRKVDDYFAAIDAGRLPIERGFRRSPPDLRLTLLFRNLQGMAVDRKDYHTRFGLDVVEEYDPAWQVLSERGWLEVTEQRVRVVGDGVFFTPLIQALLSAARTAELREAMYARNP